MYTIRFEPDEQLLYVRLEGFWTVATLACFAAEMLARGTILKMRGRVYGVLSDARAFPIQSPTVAAGLDKLMARGAEVNIGPSAIVVGTMLNKLQAERTLTSARAGVFLDDIAAARAWLAEELVPA